MQEEYKPMAEFHNADGCKLRFPISAINRALEDLMLYNSLEASIQLGYPSVNNSRLVVSNGNKFLYFYGEAIKYHENALEPADHAIAAILYLAKGDREKAKAVKERINPQSNDEYGRQRPEEERKLLENVLEGLGRVLNGKETAISPRQN